MTRSRVAIISLCALLSAGAACKDTAGASAGAPATTTPPATAPPAADPADKPADPASGEPTTPPTDVAFTECTPDTRKNGICTREYRPVCGKKTDDSRATFPNKCTACSDTAVVGYFEGGCEAEAPEK